MKYFRSSLCLFILLILLADSQVNAHEVGFKLKHDSRERKLLLVTGCGRSGTGFMAEFLNRSGVHVGHETMDRDGSVSWLLAADIGWAPWGPLFRNYRFKHIFHQVRNPLKVIQSFYNVPPRAGWDWIEAVIPEIDSQDTNLTKCAKYWIYWNRLSKSISQWTFRIEDFDREYKKMGKKIGMYFDYKVLASIPKDTNTKGPPTRVITWEVLQNELSTELYQLLRSESALYGY